MNPMKLTVQPHTPTLVNHKGVYYLFATNQDAYWWSDDLLKWNFIYNPLPPNESGDDMCAPAAWSKRNTLMLINSTWAHVPLYYSTDPKKDSQKNSPILFPRVAGYPALSVDDDGRMYFYWGSGNDPVHDLSKEWKLIRTMAIEIKD